jgi:hypothetical protein
MAVLTRILACLCLLLALTGCRTGEEQWGPFRGRVVDAETGNPIAGAYVTVLWIREPPNFHFTQWFYDAQETVTDANGLFEIPRRTRLLTAFVNAPRVGVFAPAYLMQTPDVAPPGRRWVDATLVRMRPLKTRAEQCKFEPGSFGLGASRRLPRFTEAVQQYLLKLDCRASERTP